MKIWWLWNRIVWSANIKSALSDRRSIYFRWSACTMHHSFCIISLAFCILEYLNIFHMKGDIKRFISSSEQFLRDKWLLRYLDFKFDGLFFDSPCIKRFLFWHVTKKLRIVLYEPRNWHQWNQPCFQPWVLTPMILALFSSMCFDANVFNLVFIQGFWHQWN